MSQTPNVEPIYPNVGDPLVEKELEEGEFNYDLLLFAAPMALLSGPLFATHFPKLFTFCCTKHILCHAKESPFFTATTISGLSLWTAVKLAQTRLSTVRSFLNEPIAVKPLDIVSSVPSLFLGAALFAKIFI